MPTPSPEPTSSSGQAAARVHRDFRRGLKAGAAVIPTFLAIFTAVGLAASLLQVPALVTLAATLWVFAAPAQFAMLDAAAQSSALVQVVSVGVLVNLRFFLMSLTLSTLFEGVARHRLLLWGQFVSASSYLITFFESRNRAAGSVDLFAYYRGIVCASFPAAVLGTVVGVWFGGSLPEVLGFAAALFLPIYFTLLVMSERKSPRESVAVVIGCAATPIAESLVPGWGLFIVALSAGFALEQFGHG